ncbi:MAG: anti-sigma F factor [Firmicutes bacterium]|nr:anti-sigma F factor [Bacillota bacterium]
MSGQELHNHIELTFAARAENVALARLLVAALAAAADPTLAELEEVKVAVSEAVSNAIIHGYGGDAARQVQVSAELDGRLLLVSVRDEGVGIRDIELAMSPSYSTEEVHLGLGFAFMTGFMDDVQVMSAPQQGTTVRLAKHFAG